MTFLVDSIVFLSSGAIFYKNADVQVRRETTIVINLPISGQVDFQTAGLEVLDWRKDTFMYARIPRYRSLEKRLEAVRWRVDSMKTEAEALALNLDQLKATVKQIENGKATPSPSFLASVRNSYIVLSTRKKRLEKRIGEVEKSLKAIEDSVNWYRKLKSFGRLVLRVRPISAGGKSVQVSVYNSRASFKPLYSYYISSGDFNTILNMKADLRFGGKNPLVYYDVRKIILSSRPAVFSVERPRPTPWYINRAGLPVPVMKGVPEKLAEGAMAPMKEKRTVEVREAPYSYEVVVSGRRTLRYRGSNVVDLLEHRTRLDVQYYAYPRYSEKVFMIAIFQNDFMDLPPGKAVFYLDGRRVGEGRVGYVAKGDVDTLTMGWNPRITAKRMMVDRTFKKKGLIGKKRIVEKRTYRTKFVNHERDNARIIAYFNKPIPRIPDVKVEKYSIDLRSCHEGDNGILTCTVVVPAGRTLTVIEEIEVSYPEGMEVRW